jgi:hypothetical protein
MGEPSKIELRKELKALWSELEGWLGASDTWTAAKVNAAAKATAPPVAWETPAGELSRKDMNDVEEWRSQFHDELQAVEHAVARIAACSHSELLGTTFDGSSSA